jgi:hypothetical protein
MIAIAVQGHNHPHRVKRGGDRSDWLDLRAIEYEWLDR